MNVQKIPEEVTRAPGYVEYACRMAIRDLIAELGVKAARERINEYYIDEIIRETTGAA